MKSVSLKLSDYTEATLFSLIEEVKKYEFLHSITTDQRSSTSSVVKRDELWNDIGDLFGIPGDEALTIWKRLRMTFSRHYKNYHAFKDTTRPFDLNSWKYFDSLLFLIPHLEYTEPKVPSDSSSKAATAKLPKKVKRLPAPPINEESHRELTAKIEAYDEIPQQAPFDTLKFIDIMKQHPIIYTEIKNPTNASQKTTAWMQVAEKMGYSVKICMGKWRRLWEKVADPKGRWYSELKCFSSYRLTRRKLPKKQTEAAVAPSASPDAPSSPADETYSPIPPSPSFPTDLKFSTHDRSPVGAQEVEMETETQSEEVGTQSGEYHFGMCIAQMIEDTPKAVRGSLKARIMNIMVSALNE